MPRFMWEHAAVVVGDQRWRLCHRALLACVTELGRAAAVASAGSSVNGHVLWCLRGGLPRRLIAASNALPRRASAARRLSRQARAMT